MKILIACEYSGTVRRAFSANGHNVTSCDLLPSDDNSKDHYQGDVFDLLKNNKYDLMIAHPPCTHLAVSGAAWFKAKRESGVQQEALAFVQRLMDADIPKICIENPVSIISSQIRKPEQIIQPYQFGHLEQKKTCLWLKNLPKLTDTSNVYEEMMMLPKKDREKMHYLPPSPDRWKLRSKTYQGIADAMANQWGSK
jgi:site-specific DNA-cytosine methylase